MTKELRKELKEKIKKDNNNLKNNNLIIIKEEKEYYLYDYQYKYIDKLEYQVHKSKNEYHLYFNDILYERFNIKYFLLNNKDNKRLDFINKNNYYIIEKKEKREKRILKRKDNKINIINSIDILLDYLDNEKDKMIIERLKNEKIKLNNLIEKVKKEKELKSEFENYSVEELIMMKKYLESKKKS